MLPKPRQSSRPTRKSASTRVSGTQSKTKSGSATSTWTTSARSTTAPWSETLSRGSGTEDSGLPHMSLSTCARNKSFKLTQKTTPNSLSTTSSARSLTSFQIKTPSTKSFTFWKKPIQWSRSISKVKSSSTSISTSFMPITTKRPTLNRWDWMSFSSTMTLSCSRTFFNRKNTQKTVYWSR